MSGDTWTGGIRGEVIYKFNNFSLDTEQYRLCHSDKSVSIEPLAFDLLVYLIEHRDRVVTREELLDNLWEGKVVTHSALGGRLKVARQAVKDNGKKQAVIKTLHGRGYQFIAEVSEQCEKSTTAATRLDTADTANDLETYNRVKKPSIAVLPFVSMSEDPEQEYFSDGITEDIITGLSRFRELFVIARGSSFAFKGQAVNVTEAAAKLGARYMLEGSVRLSGDRVRVTAQLCDAITGNHLWAEKYDRVLEDVFAVQDDVAQKITSTLAGQLEEESLEQALKKSASNLSAYDYYLRGKYLWPDWRGSKENVLRAREMFEKSMELDPDYASAYIGLAESYLAESWSSWTTDQDAAGSRAFEYASRAVELDNRDSHAHLTLAASYLYVKSNFDLADIQIQMALDLNPNDYWNYCFKTDLSLSAGNFEESIHCGNEAINRNPFLPDGCLHRIGFSEYFAKRYDNAIQTFGKLASPGLEVQGCIAACYAQLGSAEHASVAATEFRARAREELTSQRVWDEENWREYLSELFSFKDPVYLDHLIDGLNNAGLVD